MFKALTREHKLNFVVNNPSTIFGLKSNVLRGFFVETINKIKIISCSGNYSTTLDSRILGESLVFVDKNRKSLFCVIYST